MDYVTYEWTQELVDEYEDIQAVEFEDKYSMLIEHDHDEDGCDYERALVANWGNDEDGLGHREYAYIKNGKLPEAFNNGHKIPKRFHAEIAK